MSESEFARFGAARRTMPLAAARTNANSPPGVALRAMPRMTGDGPLDAFAKVFAGMREARTDSSEPRSEAPTSESADLERDRSADTQPPEQRDAEHPGASAPKTPDDSAPVVKLPKSVEQHVAVEGDAGRPIPEASGNDSDAAPLSPQRSAKERVESQRTAATIDDPSTDPSNAPAEDRSITKPPVSTDPGLGPAIAERSADHSQNSSDVRSTGAHGKDGQLPPQAETQHDTNLKRASDTEFGHEFAATDQRSSMPELNRRALRLREQKDPQAEPAHGPARQLGPERIPPSTQRDPGPSAAAAGSSADANPITGPSASNAPARSADVVTQVAPVANAASGATVVPKKDRSPVRTGGVRSDAINNPTGAVTGADATGSRVANGDRAGRSRAGGSDTAEAVSRAKLIQRVSRAFQTMGGQGGVVRLRLAPADLGTIRIEMRVRNSQIDAKVLAESEAVSQTLREHLPELRSRLEQQGLTVERIEIDTESRDPTGEQPGRGTTDDFHQDHRRRQPTLRQQTSQSRSSGLDPSEISQPTGPAGAASGRVGTEGVDVRW